MTRRELTALGVAYVCAWIAAVTAWHASPDPLRTHWLVAVSATVHACAILITVFARHT